MEDKRATPDIILNLARALLSSPRERCLLMLRIVLISFYAHLHTCAFVASIEDLLDGIMVYDGSIKTLNDHIMLISVRCRIYIRRRITTSSGMLVIKFLIKIFSHHRKSQKVALFLPRDTCLDSFSSSGRM